MNNKTINFNLYDYFNKRPISLLDAIRAIEYSQHQYRLMLSNISSDYLDIVNPTDNSVIMTLELTTVMKLCDLRNMFNYPEAIHKSEL